MTGRVLAAIVAGGTGLEIGAGALDAALTPFGGRYRFVDFALAALRHAGIAPVWLLTPDARGPVVAHVTRTAPSTRDGVQVLEVTALRRSGRRVRIRRALAACREIARAQRADVIVLLAADHVVRLDLGALLRAHRTAGADVTLAACPVGLDEARARAVLDVADGGRVRSVVERSSMPPPAPGTTAFALAWAGDLVASTAALDRWPGGTGPFVGAGGAVHVHAADVLELRGPSPYWHDPEDVEEYYDAQMRLCSPTPPLDLDDPAWPLPRAHVELPPARVVGDGCGRPAHVVSALLSDGVIVRGGTVVNAVLGPGAVVEGGAEVEDCILLDGARIGRGARVRRALLGPDAVVHEGEQIGYGDDLRTRPSGLTVVATSAPRLAASAAR